MGTKTYIKSPPIDNSLVSLLVRINSGFPALQIYSSCMQPRSHSLPAPARAQGCSVVALITVPRPTVADFAQLLWWWPIF